MAYIRKNLELGFEWFFIGAVFKDRTNEYANYQPSRWIYNIYFTYYFFKDKDLDRQTLFTLEVRNIQNKRISDIVGYPLPGRMFYATFSAKF